MAGGAVPRRHLLPVVSGAVVIMKMLSLQAVISPLLAVSHRSLSFFANILPLCEASFASHHYAIAFSDHPSRSIFQILPLTLF
jgi:hypothetical protein